MKLFKFVLFFCTTSFIILPIYAYQVANHFTVNGQVNGQAGVGAESVENSKAIIFGGGLARLKMNETTQTSFYAGSQAHFVIGQNFASDSYLRKPQNWLYRVTPLVWYPYSSGKDQSVIYIDRLNAMFNVAGGTLTVGRQAISFGKDFFWSPLDIFRPFQPAQVDRDYKSGTDAVRYDYSLGTFTGLNFVVSPSEENKNGDITWDSSALMARIYSTLVGYDVSAMGGKMYGGYFVGAGVSGDIKGIEVRGEGLSYFHDTTQNSYRLINKDGFSGVLGTGYTWPNTLAVEAEYYYDSFGTQDFFNLSQVADTYVLYFAGLIPNLSRNLLGGSVSYDITPIITGRFSSIVSLTKNPSVMLQPDLTYGLTDNIDLVGAFSVGLGESTVFIHGIPTTVRSEFGNLPYSIIFQLKYYW